MATRLGYHEAAYQRTGFKLYKLFLLILGLCRKKELKRRPRGSLRETMIAPDNGGNNQGKNNTRKIQGNYKYTTEKGYQKYQREKAEIHIKYNPFSNIPKQGIQP